MDQSCIFISWPSVDSFLKVLCVFPEPQSCPAVQFYYSKANNKAQILFPKMHKARKDENPKPLACHRRQWHEMCRSTKGTSSQAKNGEKRWYQWICELSTSQWLRLSCPTWHKWLNPQEKLCPGSSPHQGRTATPQCWSGPDPKTFWSGLVNGVKLQP